MLNEAISKMPQAFDPKVLLRGQEYFQKGSVLNIRLSEGLIRGRVKGSSSQIYDVHMDLKAWPASPARCTCTYQFNCKHAAACLFALREREHIPVVQHQADHLDRKLDTWLKNLRAQEAITRKVSTPSHQLVYLLDLKLSGLEHKVGIELALAKQLKRGGYGKKAAFTSLSESKKQHFTAEDNDIVAQLLYKSGISGWLGNLSIRNSELLLRILKTGRAFFSGDEEQPIALGEQVTGTCQWLLAPNGDQRLFLMSEDTIIEPLLLDDSWYFNVEETVMGKLISPYPSRQLRHLLEAPSIPLDQAALLADKMRKTCPEFPPPQVFTNREVHQLEPTPVLILDTLNCSGSRNHWMYDDASTNKILFVVAVSFDYAGVTLGSNDHSSVVVKLEGAALHEYQRDRYFEAEKLQLLRQSLKLRSTHQYENYNCNLEPDAVLVMQDVNRVDDLNFLYQSLIPQLKQSGWRIEFASPLYQEVVNEEDVEWFSELAETTNDFFSYKLGILVDGKAVSIVALVADLIQRFDASDLDAIADTQLVKLPLTDGRALQLQMGRIKPLIRLLLQFGLRHIIKEDELKINKYQFILMQEAELALAATRGRWQGAERLRETLKLLSKHSDLPAIPTPKGLDAQLRDYQHYGLNWLQLLRTSQFSGVLADDMGLGKTMQTLAHLQYEKEQGRLQRASLIIVPTSLVGNWSAEAKRFTPQLNLLIYHGSERHQDSFDAYDIVVSTYGLIHRDKDKFVEYDFYYLILDEAQFIKNSRTKTTQVIQQLKASHRLCLTGTPMENHLGELWSLFHFLMPGLLGDAKQFRNWFKTPIEKFADNSRRELLARRVQPFMLRRTKNQVARELPPKTEITRSIEIDGAQRDLYEAIRMSMEKKVRDAIAKQGLGKSHIVLLDALLKLRQVCCDPRLISLPEAKIAHGASAKLEALLDLLDNLVEEGRRVLVFSQFTSMLQLIEEAIKARKYPYLKLTGQTQNRQALVDTFQQGAIPIFLISLKAGGTGLNLTKADTVIHYDPWWNPAVEDQATDRTHRIGQENPVFVYKLIIAGTVEEAIISMQERKKQLTAGILASDTSKPLALSEADIDQFFMPLGS